MDDVNDNPEPLQELKKEVPLHARLFWYQLEPAELLALKGMVEHCSNGSVIFPSIRRLSAYTKLSKKQLQRLIHGWDERKKEKATADEPEADATGKKKKRWIWKITKHREGFLERGILTQVAKHNKAKRQPATYRLNEAVLTIDPAMYEFIAQDMQGVLPGVDRKPAPGERVRPKQKTLPGMTQPAKPKQRELSGLRGKSGTPSDTMSPVPTSDTMSPVASSSLATPCRMTSDTMSPYPLIDSLKILNTTTTEIFEELAKGLREILPLLDDKAIQQVWMECRGMAPDCTVQEVVNFAWEKAPAIKKADNPTGLLIHSVPQLCSPTILAAYRQRQQDQEEAYREGERQRVLTEEHNRRYMEAHEQASAQTQQRFDEMTSEERAPLRAKVLHLLRTNMPNAQRWSDPEIEKYMKNELKKEFLEKAGFKW